MKYVSHLHLLHAYIHSDTLSALKYAHGRMRSCMLVTCTGEKYSREVRIITADFSKGLEIYPNLGEQLKDLDIGVLGECIKRAMSYHCHEVVKRF